MSELQISLLILGIAIVVALYLYSGWQQHRYRRKFGAPFKPNREDVLYQQPVEKSAPEAAPPNKNSEDNSPTGNDGCDLLNAATDYIATLTLDHPANSGALGKLWQQRFDFGKSVYMCGLNASNGTWEKVMLESRELYSSFKLALQLVNRSGAVSEVALTDFRDMARAIATQLKANVSLPDVVQAADCARELDNFCAGVDQVIVLNLPGGERTLPGREISRIAAKLDFSLQADGSFHLFDGLGHTMFSLGNSDNTPFQHHTIAQTQVHGLTLSLDVPRVAQPVLHFDQMLTLARQLASDLQATVVDDRHVALSEPGIKLIREQIAAVEAKMLAGHIVPGSAQAYRLFS